MKKPSLVRLALRIGSGAGMAARDL